MNKTFYKQICKNGLLWYLIKLADEIINRAVVVAEIERVERDLTIAEMEQRIAVLQMQQNSYGVLREPRFTGHIKQTK